jgi:hypothetical protein
LLAGAQGEVVRVRQNHLGAGLAQSVRIDTLHRALRADRHERRCFDRAVGRRERTAPRLARRIDMVKLKRESGSRHGFRILDFSLRIL